MTLRKLGSLQEKALYFLAENPRNHKQAIQKGIGYPDDQYGSVSNAVDALEKLKFITYKKGMSEKSVEIKFYSCTEEGVVYSLANNSEANFNKTLNLYKKYPFIGLLKTQYDSDQDLFNRMFKRMIQVLPMLGRRKPEDIIGYLLMAFAQDAKSFSMEERVDMLKRLGKFSPKAKEAIDIIKKLFDQVQGDEE
jgi:DNA-binding PadR family transcriptional regulator